MEFLFLGTGPAEAIPRRGHKDALCRDAMKPHSKSRRLRSAGILKKGDTTVLFDAGPDIGYQLAAHRVEKIDAVVLTHSHLDAAGGLKALDEWARKRGVLVPVYTEVPTRRRYGDFGNLPYQFVKSGGIVKVVDVSIRFFRVRHSLRPGYPTLGFRVGKFAYASDAASIPGPSLKILQGVSALILDAAFWFGQKYRGHLTPDRALNYAMWLGVERLILTQTGHTYPPHRAAEAFFREFARQRASEMKTAIAHDGMRIIFAASK